MKLKMFDHIFISTLVDFTRSSYASRNIKAFKCFLVSILMIFAELTGTAAFLLGAMMRLTSIVLSILVAGSYIVFVHPVMSVFNKSDR